MCYTCPIPYVSERIHAAALYCSDGRVGEHFDDFLTKGLGMPRVDRLCLPGGPASLAGHAEAHVEQQGAVDALGFLIEAHGLDRVVLIQHEGCAFYTARLGLDGAGIRRLAHLDARNLIAGTASAASAPIGNARAIYADGVLSHINRAAEAAGAEVGMTLRAFIDHLLAEARAGR